MKSWSILKRPSASTDDEVERQIADHQKQTYGKAVSLSSKEIANHTYTVDEEKRIAYYLGDLEKRNLRYSRACFSFNRLLVKCYSEIVRSVIFEEIRWAYAAPLLNVLNLLPDEYKQKPFWCLYGDNPSNGPPLSALVQARRVGNRSTTIFKFLQVRYWGPVKRITSLDIPYQQKKSEALWRGASTGNRKQNNVRWALVEKFYAHKLGLNVGFSGLVQKVNAPANYVKAPMSIAEQLEYKFLICLEGNDVASGLMWMLRSNSVVLMPKPKYSSWLMEERLEPYVHYIPISDDLADLEAQQKWAVENEEKCLAISKRASHYIKEFLDPRKEVLIECAVMKRYLDNITVVNGPHFWRAAYVKARTYAGILRRRLKLQSF